MSEEEDDEPTDGVVPFGDGDAGDGDGEEGAGMSGVSTGFVSTGKPLDSGGAVLVAPTSTTAPTDATTALANTFVKLGYVSEDGITNSIESDTEDIKDWNGDTVLTVRTSRAETFQWTMISTMTAVLKEVYGDANVVEEGGVVTVKHNGDELSARMFVFEVLLTGDRVKRIVVPNAKITSLGDVVYKAGEPIGYDVTVSCMPDSNGNTATEYIAAIPSAGS